MSSHNGMNMGAGSPPSQERKRKEAPGTVDQGVSNKRAAAVGSAPIPETANATLLSTPAPTNQVNDEWKEKLDMSPPQKKDTTVHDGTTTAEDASIAEVAQKMMADGMGDFKVPQGAPASDESKIVHFLYGIEFGKDLSRDARVAQIREFLDQDAKPRMLHLLQEDSDTTNCPDNVDLWREIQSVVLRYSKQDNDVTIFDGKNMPLVLRIQATKNCYQHATGGTVGYKIAFHQGDNENKVYTVDVAKFMCRQYNDRKLKRRVLQNKGGASKRLLDNQSCATVRQKSHRGTLIGF
ncbi:expressed unknown protein [Seminavis robusta]|uniref:Uncharacterized protein n=1 Tax=Seminavis robusta TaxID=568900 RepID=A0A9N8HMM2_9STRA|nr:expressed unknown protein [Seminavis robusta]|eukprot:Sro757_g197870.1 n/a (294) ;mRNA; f:2233-3114